MVGMRTDMFTAAGQSHWRWGDLELNWDWVRYQIRDRHNTESRGFG